jgi:hypothetical protein
MCDANRVISHTHMSIIAGYFCHCSVNFYKNENSFLLWLSHLIWNHIKNILYWSPFF